MSTASLLKLGVAGLVYVSIAGAALAADKPLAGITLNLASQNDQFAPVIAKLAPNRPSRSGRPRSAA